jgi:glycosyltransferase involved in cell wall biosynthesis
MNSTSTPLVSVLVGAYNQSKVVETSIDSILAQTYQNIEIIISDDASTDGTQDVLKRTAKNNPTIRLFLQERNLGITRNYNFIASKANGKYLALFAGDDVMFPEKINEQVKLLEDNRNSSFCHHAVQIIDYAGNKSREVISHHYKNGITTIHDVLRNLGIPGAMAIVCRRDSVKDPLMDPEIPTASDWLQMIHLTMAGRGLYIDKPLCFYRKDAEYNRKDPSRYENDFVKTISLARAAYASHGDAIDRSCDYALARYSMGAGYRRLVRGEREIARSCFKVARSEPKFMIPAYLLGMISFLNLPPRLLFVVKRIYKKR